MYGAAPEIGEVMADSSAFLAGLKKGDVIVEIEGQPVFRMAQILHFLGTKYEGDKISLKYKRGKEVVAVNDMQLVGQLTSMANAFLGVLPMRDDPKLGVEIRYVFPKSPAEKAGLKPGDRIVQYGSSMDMHSFSGAVSGREELLSWLSTQSGRSEIKLDVLSKDGKTSTLEATLENFPGTTVGQDTPVPDKLPLLSSFKKALAPLETTKKNKPAKIEANPNKVETGLVKHNTTDGEHKYWVYIPDDYDPNIAYGLIVWLHPPGKNKEPDMENITDAWSDYCKENQVIMVCPKSENESGWTPSEAEYVVAAIRETINQCTIDHLRVVTHGMGVGGQMAIYLGLSQRDLIRGVATTGAVVTQLKDNIPAQRLSFYLAAGMLDPLVKNVAESRDQLQQRKFPVIFREIKGRGREYLEDAQINEIIRWIDCLDRI